MLQAGWAELDITPPVGSIIPGQWLSRTAERALLEEPTRGGCAGPSLPPPFGA